MLRTGINRALWLFGGVQIASILGFVLLAFTGPDLGRSQRWWDSSTSASGSVRPRSSHSSPARRQAVHGLPASRLADQSRRRAGNTVASTAGWFAEALGWPTFFAGCTLLAIPGMLMLPWSHPGARPKD